MVAEGVETEVAYTGLARLGCDEAQGYFISTPVPAAELDYWLTTRHILLPQTRGSCATHVATGEELPTVNHPVTGLAAGLPK
jgi:predicted signal transduction protein with EAL and GGDEF domain